MSQPQRKPMTSAEFLAWEAKQEFKWEFDGLQPVAMNGGTFAHASIQGNVIAALVARLRGKPCRPCGCDMRVPTGGGRYRYPDALVTCAPMRSDALDAPEPVVIFEVLSQSTEHNDRKTKLREYCSIPSLQRYVMLEQDEMAATVVARTATGWSLDLLDAAGTLSMPEIGVDMALAELYADVEFTATDEDAA